MAFLFVNTKAQLYMRLSSHLDIGRHFICGCSSSQPSIETENNYNRMSWSDAVCGFLNKLNANNRSAAELAAIATAAYSGCT